MGIYQRLSATSLRLVTKYGLSVTLRRLSSGGGDYNTDTGVATLTGENGSFDSNRRAITTDAPGKRLSTQFGMTLENGTLIQNSDKWIYLDNNGPAPRLQDQLIMQDITYSIVDVQITNPGGIDLMYLLVLRA